MGGVKLLKASAGSGKTFQLAYEYVRAVVEEPMRYRHILAVTFTNKATEEMKRRIIKEIDDLARGKETLYAERLRKELGLDPGRIAARALLARTNILHDYSRFAVLTIDKFFQRIIRSFIKELGIDMNFNLELRTDPLLSQAADALIDEIGVNAELRAWITAFVEEKISENRKWDVKEGLTSLGSEIFGEKYRRRGASSASREQLAKIVDKASAQAAAITAGMKADAVAALGIMSANGLSPDDFPYKDKGFIAYFLKTAAGVIEKPGARAMGAVESEENWYSKNSPRKDDIRAVVPQLQPLMAKICDAYDKSHIFLNSAALLRRHYRNFALLDDLAGKVAAICREQGIMPISNTNHILNKLVAGNDTPFIFEKAGNHYTRFMIDEFQDTSAMQWENFIPLLQNATAQSADTPVLLVGDVKQSIYRWRSGDWRILAREIEGQFSDVLDIALTTNYRSLPGVIEFNNNVIARCVAADNDHLNGLLDQALADKAISPATHAGLHDMLRTAYTAHDQGAVEGKSGGYVTVTLYDEPDDGEWEHPVVSRIEQLQDRGYAPGDIAVLVRTNAQGVKVANMLLERKRAAGASKYTYDVVTQEALLINSSPAVDFILACFRLAGSPGDSLARAVVNRRQGRAFPDELPSEEAEFFASLGTKPPQEAFEAVSAHYEMGRDAADIPYLQAFHEQILDFTSTSIGDIPLFLKWWDESGGNKSVNLPPSSSAITIISIHKSKGLQYKAVLIPYCNWKMSPKANSIIWAEDRGGQFGELGAFPVGFSDKMGESAFADDYFDELVLSHIDNINLFYVAATRAEYELHLMMPAGAAKATGNIGRLVMDSITINATAARVGGLEGCVLNQNPDDMQVGFGEPYALAPEAGKPQDGIITVPYASYKTGERLKLRTPSRRYTEAGITGAVIASRDYGILMHKAFESARNAEDIQHNIDAMTAAGAVSTEEAEKIAETVARAFDNPQVRSWFDGNWRQVRNENDIIIPGDDSTRRPDRVMVKEGRTVVVDYKFGLNRPASYMRQMRLYMDLLRRMGYAGVEGYIWYVSLGEIEPVTEGQLNLF